MNAASYSPLPLRTQQAGRVAVGRKGTPWTLDAAFASRQHERARVAAAVEHLRNFAATFGARFVAMVERKRFLVFGQPSDALRAILDEFNAAYHRPFGPFAYWG
jgi:hypothetical protein